MMRWGSSEQVVGLLHILCRVSSEVKSVKTPAHRFMRVRIINCYFHEILFWSVSIRLTTLVFIHKPSFVVSHIRNHNSFFLFIASSPLVCLSLLTESRSFVVQWFSTFLFTLDGVSVVLLKYFHNKLMLSRSDCVIESTHNRFWRQCCPFGGCGVSKWISRAFGVEFINACNISKP